MKKIYLVLSLLFSLILLSIISCKSECLSDSEQEYNIPDGYVLLKGELSPSSDVRSAFGGLDFNENLYYKVTAVDNAGVLETVTATLVKNGPNMVIQKTDIKTSSSYQLMLPVGVWNISVVGYLAYSYDAVEKLETYTTPAVYALKNEYEVQATGGYTSSLNFVSEPEFLGAAETGTVELPITISAASVLGAKATWKQTIDGTETTKTQTLTINSGETLFTMIADDGTNTSGVPSGNYIVQFYFYENADCTGNLLYTCQEAVNVLYKVISTTNKWIKSSGTGTPYLKVKNSTKNNYYADFIIDDAILFNASNEINGYTGNGSYSVCQDNVLIKINNTEFSHDTIETKTVTAFDLTGGTQTSITNVATDWKLVIYNSGGQDISTSEYFAVTGKAIASLKDLPYEEEFKLYVSFCYKERYYSATFDMKVESEFNFYDKPIDVATGLPATSSSTSVYFGVFPQTVLPSTSTVVISETKTITLGGNTYYKGDDKNYYLKVLENCYSGSNSYKYTDGSFAKASSNSSYRYFKLEPIKWKVLTTNYNGTGKALLHATECVMSNVPFCEVSTDRTIGGVTAKPYNYKFSTVRAYLNGKYEAGDTQTQTYLNIGFLQNAFTTGGQNNIVTTSLVNDLDSTTMNDKIFLLSISEASNSTYGFPAENAYGTVNGAARIRLPTDYAYASYVQKGSVTTLWFLRGPVVSASFRKVDSDCDISSNYGKSTSYTAKYFGIVPALCVSLE